MNSLAYVLVILISINAIRMEENGMWMLRGIDLKFKVYHKQKTDFNV